MGEIARIAIIGLACRYPDANTPGELWENVLSQRRAFRRIPSERLRLEDYFAEDGGSSDSIYSSEAALLEGYEFDRVRFRVGGRSFRAADLTHWLALEVASEALADAGCTGAAELPRDDTGVLVGNTLTGEFSRAQLLRLRWPYVRRQMAAALAEERWDAPRVDAFLARFETRYKEPFPENTEESLAGGLSNTIAGRIANHFDLHGGGYTLDGACASSLLAVGNACSALAAGDLEVALAGGVDLSLDPFELVGFARAGALARGDMRVFDRHPTGFIPGEGCGFAVLMRLEDALARGQRIYAVIRGWGISSDGSGGLIRPEVEGQVLALRRTYRRAGFGIDTVALFEGHGTGTAIGDAVELAALNRARREAGTDCGKAAIGSIKGNVGHTKAAAGLAGLIKASLAVHRQILPPATGCVEPHSEISGEASSLRILNSAELWPEAAPLRAGVSAMGFGGINVHVTLEAAAAERRRHLVAAERRLLSTPQGAEVILLAAPEEAALREQVEKLARVASRLSRAELTDLAAELASRLPEEPAGLAVRAAAVAVTPRQLEEQLTVLGGWLAESGGEAAPHRLDLERGLFLGRCSTAPRVGLLFPGQGSPADLSGGLWRRRFAVVDELYLAAALPAGGHETETAIVQPVIATAALAGLTLLNRLGITAVAAAGHSLGELVALHWAGAFDADALRRITDVRGRAMSELGDPTGAMASLSAGAEKTAELLSATAPGELHVASFNAPEQTVITGPSTAVERAIHGAHALGWNATRLAVSRAFHSPLVAAAEPRLAAALDAERLVPVTRPVASTVTGDWLEEEEDLRALLRRQITAPVRFLEALLGMARKVDVLLEVGPGQVLTGLARSSTDLPVIALETGGSDLGGLLRAVGALFALGAPLDPAPLFRDRFGRSFDLDGEPRFLVNPCELAPLDQGVAPSARAASFHGQPAAEDEPASTASGVTTVAHDPAAAASPLPMVRQLLARRTELPPEAIAEESRLLGDLHLSSIAVGELVTEAARQLGLPPPVAPTEYSNASVGDLAQALEELAATGGAGEDSDPLLAGLDAWVRPFVVDWVERERRRLPAAEVAAWKIFSRDGHPLRAALEQRLDEAAATGDVPRDDGARGVALLLDEQGGPAHLDLLLAASKSALGERRGPFLLIDSAESRGGAAAFARTLHLEAPEIPVIVIALPPSPTGEPEVWSTRIAAEARATKAYSEVRYDTEGRRFVPVLKLLPAALRETVSTPPLDAGDVVLATGGGKGIGAECALDLARRYGARLALLGRSRPEDDPELAANLERLEALSIPCCYLRADVGDAEAVRAAVERATAELGPVRAILHSAGTNAPKLIESLDRGDVERTLEPKVTGLRHLLAAVDVGELKLLVGFGSIIARMGLRGEADYALANEALRRTIEDFAAEQPSCRALCLEWSVWSGVGMGARLVDLDALAREGISPIPPEAGVAMLHDLLARPTPVAVIVTGRFGDPPTLTLDRPELPLRRFLETPQIHVPGVELVVDAELSTATDPYLAEHVFGGQCLFPAVLGLEAMAQAGLVLMERASARGLVLRDIRFERPVVVPEDEPVTLRLAALVRRSGEVEVALRSSRTSFRIDHFRAVLALPDEEPAASPAVARVADPVPEANGDRLPLEPHELYGPVLFQAGRFRRIQGYRRLRATECLAEIGPGDPVAWFGPLLPAELELGDPGARDASIHAVQACIPHSTVLPAGVERLVFGPAVDTASSATRNVTARERSHQGRTLIYDLDVRREDGELIERWEGLELRAVEDRSELPSLAPPLLGPYLERRLGDLLPEASLRVAVIAGAGDRRTLGQHVVEQALGRPVAIVHRPDGKPEAVPLREAETIDGQSVSIAYGGDLAMALAGQGPVGCDVERVRNRPTETWHDLLGEHHELVALLARETHEDEDALATRVWTVIEGLKKAGGLPSAPFVYSRTTADGWMLFSSVRHVAATVLLGLAGSDERVSIATVAEQDSVH